MINLTSRPKAHPQHKTNFDVALWSLTFLSVWGFLPQAEATKCRRRIYAQLARDEKP
jgi:hypothetical protein